MEKIEMVLEALKSMYLTLIKANKDFAMELDREQEDDDDDEVVASEPEAGFEALVAHRSVIVDDSELLIAELKQLLIDQHENLSFDNKNFVEILFKILELYPSLIEKVEALNVTLGELVESDKLVSAKLETLRAAIKSELGQVRQNSKSLKGYSQLDSYGSCFINKFK